MDNDTAPPIYYTVSVSYTNFADSGPSERTTRESLRKTI